MRLELQIVFALLLDAALGDPRWLPHPVRFFGWLARVLERPALFSFPPRIAGTLVAISVVGAAIGSSIALLRSAKTIHPFIEDIAAIVLLYFAFAAGDLALHAKNVLTPLSAGDMVEARRRVGLMVGRDTQELGDKGIARAAVESVAENTVDGITAPLLFACLLGPAGAMAYKAINTLDSTFGYKTERFRLFGWASARLDDAANWIPARLTGWLIPGAAFIAGQRGFDSLRVMLRDRNKHTSPNAGIAEAAFAGAMGVQLGGLSSYQGQNVEKPTIGDGCSSVCVEHIQRSIRLMWITTALAAISFIPLGILCRRIATAMGGP
jgi:adenosylcobinamide-phosphate synthase